MSERILMLVRIALRNIRRQARRSALTASAMVLGIALLMLARALEGGAHLMYVDSAVRMGTGHVTLEHPQYAGSQDLAHRITAPELIGAERIVAEVGAREGIEGSFPRVSVGGLLQSASSSIPVRIHGVDPAREAPISYIAEKVTEGRFLEPDDRLEAVIGAGVAERLRVELGSRLVLMAQGAGGELESQLIFVTGVFRTGIPEVDRGVVQLPLETAREWLQLGSDATSLSVILASDDRSSAMAAGVRAGLLDATPGSDVEVKTWREALPDLHAGLQADRVSTYVLFLILLAIVALAVVNSVLMAVLHRTREFGVLRALGLSRGAVGMMVLIEGTVLTLASGVAGLLLGLFVARGIFGDGLDFGALVAMEDFAFGGAVVDPVVIPVVMASDVTAILSIVITMGVLASIYPAWHATRIQPADAMKTDD